MTAKLLVFFHSTSIVLLNGQVLGPVIIIIVQILTTRMGMHKIPPPPRTLYGPLTADVSSILTGEDEVFFL